MLAPLPVSMAALVLEPCSGKAAMEVICLQSLNIYFGLLEKNLEDFCLEESMKQTEFF